MISTWENVSQANLNLERHFFAIKEWNEQEHCQQYPHSSTSALDTPTNVSIKNDWILPFGTNKVCWSRSLNSTMLWHAFIGGLITNLEMNECPLVGIYPLHYILNRMMPFCIFCFLSCKHEGVLMHTSGRECTNPHSIGAWRFKNNISFGEIEFLKQTRDYPVHRVSHGRNSSRNRNWWHSRESRKAWKAGNRMRK